MGRFFRISEFALSFILVAFATSLPEFFLGLSSAIKGVSVLSLGNLIGANVLDLSLVIGVALIAAGDINFKNIFNGDDAKIAIGATLLPALFILDGVLGRGEGIILLFLFAGYVVYLLSQKERVSPKLDNIARPHNIHAALGGFTKHLVRFILGAIILLLASSIVVSKSIEFSHLVSIPVFFVGVLTALGTTLPELVFSIKSVFMKHSSMSLGNAFGSVIVNILLVLGVVSVINPVIIPDVSAPLFGIAATVFVIITISATGFIWGKLSRIFGLFLLLLSAVFLVVQSAF